jgi:hypothetical protein
MRGDEFRSSVSGSAPPAALTPALEALWWAANDDWTRAHEMVTDHLDDDACAWVHAYLHRVEGDLPNAQYWYRRASRPVETRDLRTEWDTIVETLLKEMA